MHCLSGRKLCRRLHLNFVVCWAVITITVVASVGRLSRLQFVASVGRLSRLQFVASVAKTPFIGACCRGCRSTSRKADEQTNRKADKQESRQARKHTSRQAGKQTSRKADKPHRISAGLRRGGRRGLNRGQRKPLCRYTQCGSQGGDRESHSAAIHSVGAKARDTSHQSAGETQPPRHHQPGLHTELY